MRYTISVLKKAAKQFAALPLLVQRRMQVAIESLASDPRPHGSIALHGAWNSYHRLRVGDYRIVYAIDDAVRVVTIEHIGDRKEVYKR